MIIFSSLAKPRPSEWLKNLILSFFCLLEILTSLVSFVKFMLWHFMDGWSSECLVHNMVSFWRFHCPSMVEYHLRSCDNLLVSFAHFWYERFLVELIIYIITHNLSNLFKFNYYLKNHDFQYFFTRKGFWGFGVLGFCSSRHCLRIL